MADTSKKNPRKSKLLLRECTDVEVDEDVSSEMQDLQVLSAEEEAAKALLPKLKTAMTNESYLENSLSPVQFSIQIDVESCAGDENQNDEQETPEIQNQLGPKPIHEEVIISNDAIESELLRLSNSVNSDCYSQRILLIESRNTLGRLRFEPHKPDRYEDLIQNVMQGWKLWYSSSKLRTTILAYKCNICCIGWWHLQPFWDHIKSHDELSLSLDAYNHECCVVAAQGVWYENMCMCKIEGPCPKCLRTFEEHHIAKKGAAYYRCEGCFERLHTCQALFEHEGQCVRFERIIFQTAMMSEDMWKCGVCKVTCLTEERHNKHCELYHTVRSDMPTVHHTNKTCFRCKMIYHAYNLHVCRNKQNNFKCRYCCRRFSKKDIVRIHLDNTKKGFSCKVCRRDLQSQCMELEHMLKHNNQYAIVYKCGHCMDNVLLPDEISMRTHQRIWHSLRYRDQQRLFTYDMLVVPKSCMSSDWADGVSVTDMIIDVPDIQPKPTKPAATAVSCQTNTTITERIEQKFQDDKELMEVNRIMKMISADMCKIKKVRHGKGVKATVEPEPIVDDADELANTLEIINDDADKGGFEEADDHDIMETQNSVDALLSNVISKDKDKDEVIIQEPVWECIEIEDSDDDDGGLGETVSNKYLHEGQSKEKQDVVVKKETIDAEEIISEKTVKYEELNCKEKDRQINVDMAKVKQEPEPTDNSENKHILNNESGKNYNIINTDVEIKHETEEFLVFDDEMDDNDEAIKKENDACLKELSKVFRATKKHGKELQLTGISSSDELDIKEEIMDQDDFEDDIIVLSNEKMSFDIESNAEQDEIKSSQLTSQDSEEMGSDLDQTENNANINPGSFHKFLTNSGEIKVDKREKKLYRCKKGCGFVGTHRNYQNHVKNVCKRKKHLNTKEKKSENFIWHNLKCSKCEKQFKNIGLFFRHFKHHRVKKYNCPQCGVNIKDKYKAGNHLTYHIKDSFLKVQVLQETSVITWKKDRAYECKECSERVEFTNFFQHWESHLDPHDYDKLFPSPPSPPSPPAARAHASHESQLYPSDELRKLLAQLTEPPARKLRVKSDKDMSKTCVQCARRFDRRNDVKRHVVEHLLRHARAAAQTFLRCPLCTYSTAKAHELKTHLRNHASMPVFRCEMCDKCFSDSSNFAKHKKVHNFHVMSICDLCNKKFSSKFQLVKHMQMHQSTEPTRCEPCGLQFYTRSAYNKHYKSRHDKALVRLCTICSARFYTMRSLWTHMWEVHRQRRSNADCPICQRSFRKNQEVRAHMVQVHKTRGTIGSRPAARGSRPTMWNLQPESENGADNKVGGDKKSLEEYKNIAGEVVKIEEVVVKVEEVAEREVKKAAVGVKKREVAVKSTGKVAKTAKTDNNLAKLCVNAEKNVNITKGDSKSENVVIGVDMKTSGEDLKGESGDLKTVNFVSGVKSAKRTRRECVKIVKVVKGNVKNASQVCKGTAFYENSAKHDAGGLKDASSSKKDASNTKGAFISTEEIIRRAVAAAKRAGGKDVNEMNHLIVDARGVIGKAKGALKGLKRANRDTDLACQDDVEAFLSKTTELTLADVMAAKKKC